MSDLKEELSAIQHEQWSGWMRYLFSKCEKIGTDQGETVMIPKASYDWWTRQVETPYAELTDKEQESDRIEADKILAIIEREKARAYVEGTKNGLKVNQPHMFEFAQVLRRNGVNERIVGTICYELDDTLALPVDRSYKQQGYDYGFERGARAVVEKILPPGRDAYMIYMRPSQLRQALADILSGQAQNEGNSREP